jgi:signal transduction histidine kinase
VSHSASRRLWPVRRDAAARGDLVSLEPNRDTRAMKEALEERLAFLGLADADLGLLAELRPVLEEHADRLVAAFYRHLLSFDGTRRFLVDPAVRDRLLAKQRAYLLSLAVSAIDEQYVEERKRIGLVHERIGLEPRWYLGAYALYLSLLEPVVHETHRADPQRGQRTITALVRLLLLDAQLAMESFIERHEQDLQHVNRELAAASRQIALEYETQTHELRRSERRARAAEDLASIGTLVAGLAHEIGTPMGVIRGHAEALGTAVSGDRAQWRLRTILEQIDRISSIIHSLLNFARPRPSMRTEVDVCGVVDTALAFLSQKLERRSVRVERDLAELPAIQGDPDKLQQLFLNLFLNAVDAMPEGGVLRVSARVRENDAVEIEVADTGVGVAARDLDKLFEPFFTTKPPGRGSGLGLVVAHGIVVDHGGEIEVASEAGKGTTFTIRLPSARSSAPGS